jgi:hypothetical protein
MTTLQADTLIVRIPLKLRRHGGRKLVIVPEGLPEKPARRPDETLLKALARAQRWRRQIENGQARNLGEIAEAEKLGTSYVSRIFRLTLLAPDIVEAILDGRQPRTLQLANLMKDLPVEWARQREALGITSPENRSAA